MKFKVLLLTIIVQSVIINATFLPRPLSEDGQLNFTGLSEKYGHKAEEHQVITEDGYILRLFHIPGKRKPPVLLSHGLFDCADTFIIRGNRSMAIALANKGYDVWAGNGRGTKYSRQHIKLNPDTDPSFWDYSFHERGYYDLPAIMDYILNATGEKSLQSIGQSEGTTAHFVLGSLRPEYTEKFKVFIALAPIVFLSNLPPPVSIINAFGPIMNTLAYVSNTELVQDKGLLRNFLEFVCNHRTFSYEICIQVFLFSMTGSDPERLEPEFLSTFIGHVPSSSSVKSVVHYIQVAISKRFARFDYGPNENTKRYGFLVPPDYNLKLMTMKTALFVGKNDNFARIKDVEYLRHLLPNIVHYQLMEPEKWNHIDFLWAKDLPEKLFPHVFPLLEKYA